MAKRKKSSAGPNGAAATQQAPDASRDSAPGATLKGAPEARRGPRVLVVVALGAAVLAIGASALLQRWSDRVMEASSEVKSPAADYVGSNTCVECHAGEVRSWRGSDHDLAMQVADERSVVGDFTGAHFKYAGTTSTFFRRSGKFYVNTDGPGGQLADHEIKYTFGVHPLQQYLIELPGGRMQALGIAWDARPREAGGQHWFHLYPDRQLKAGDPLHWTGNAQTWNFQCAECHSTNLRKGYDANTDSYRTVWSEVNVACEACHGPASNHVAWAKKAPDTERFAETQGLLVALNERKRIRWTASGDSTTAERSEPRVQSREVDTCARCHGRGARLSDDEPHGKPVLDTHRLALLDPGLYWDDGQMRDEVYNWGPFVQSKMYAKGVTCSDCHDPHSLKLRALGNGVCAQCHQPKKYDDEAHTHHATGTAGAACVACHMATTTYMQIDARHDHSMRVPRPDLSVKLETPNACNNCHTAKTPRWAAAAILKWLGRDAAGYQRFDDAFAAALRGALEARGELVAIVDDTAQPPIARASALVRLERWLTAATLPKVTQALDDTDPIVRLAAVDALSAATGETRRQFLPRMLQDPVRAIRVEAARALVGPPADALRDAERSGFERAIDEYIAVQVYNADQPEGRTNLANIHALRGDAERAIAHYRKAIDLDPTFIPAYANLADFYRSQGAEREAEAALRAGLARNRDAAPLHHALGLALARQQRKAEAVAEFAEAVKLNPAEPRYAYVYAVALNESGRANDALQTLETANRRNPYDNDVLSTLAQYAAAAGDWDGALRYVRRLQALDPDNVESARLAAQIQRAKP